MSTPGEHAWNLRMGWFGTLELGTLDVASTGHGDDSNPWTRTWATARWVTLGLAAALAAVWLSIGGSLRTDVPR